MPTSDLRALEDPAPVLRLWDDMMRAIARLAARPFPFRRPERIVADVQISAGGCSGVGLRVRGHDLFVGLFFQCPAWARRTSTKKGRKT